MRARLLRFWDSLRASYWFIPAVMTVAAAVASQGALAVDRALLARGGELADRLYGVGDPEGALALLSTMAGSMITVAGVTFSILIVALSLASSQFGPRLLRGFLRDRGNQTVLGAFIAIFLYCLLLLRHVPMEPGTRTVPQVAVGLALVLGMVGVAFLIYFIHHAAASIQASHVIDVAGRELDGAIRQNFPARDEGERPRETIDPEEALPAGFEEKARTVEARASGYVQEIDDQGLVALATEHGLVIRLLHGRGSFILEGRPLARVSCTGALDDETAERIAEAVVLASGRISSRDVERGVSQLAEVAVRALSPGINDPFTAANAIDRMGASLALLAEREIPTPGFLDDEGELRLVVPLPTVDRILHLAFDQVRHYGKGDPHFPVGLLETLTSVGLRARHPDLRRALLHHAEAVRRTSVETLDEEADRDRVEEAFEAAAAVLGGASAGGP